MINPKAMRSIIKSTLESMNAYTQITDSDVNLIELTFLEQTDMSILYNDNGQVKHGLMGWTWTEFESFLYEVVRITPRYAEDINNIALVDVTNDSIEDVWEACTYNIALQVLLTYQFYRNRLSDMPVGADEVVDAYFRHWASSADKSKSNVKKASNNMAVWNTDAAYRGFVA